MKSLVFALCFVAVAVSANPIQERWDSVHRQCQQSPKTFVPEIIFEQLRRGERPDLPPNFGLHAYCMLVKLDLQDSQGHVLLEGLRDAVQRQYHDAAKVNQIVNECSANSDTKENTALKLFGCLRKNRVNIGQL